MTDKKRGLGRGLGALIPSGPGTSAGSTGTTVVADALLTPSRPDLEVVHDRYRQFFTGKDSDLLGQIYLYDPVIGRVNLIQMSFYGFDN